MIKFIVSIMMVVVRTVIFMCSNTPDAGPVVCPVCGNRYPAVDFARWRVEERKCLGGEFKNAGIHCGNCGTDLRASTMATPRYQKWCRTNGAAPSPELLERAKAYNAALRDVERP